MAVTNNGGRVYVLFVDDRSGSYKPYFQYSSSGGDTWNANDLPLGATAAVDSTSRQVDIAVSGVNLATTWQQDAGGPHTLYLSTSSNNGVSFKTPLVVGASTPGMHDADKPGRGLRLDGVPARRPGRLGG